MGNNCSCSSSIIEPEKGTLDIGSIDEDFEEPDYDQLDYERRVSNASQITHYDDEELPLRRLSVKPPAGGDILEDSESDESTDEGFDDTDFLDQNGNPRSVRQSAGPFPNDRKASTATQEAIYIYQASARAAGKIHDNNIKNHQTEGLGTSMNTKEQFKKKTNHSFLPINGDDVSENPIVEEDLRNKTRMGRQSLVIQPQPEPRFITEYKKKKEQQRKTLGGNVFLYGFQEEDGKSLSSKSNDSNSLKIERPDSSKSKASKGNETGVRKKRNSL